MGLAKEIWKARSKRLVGETFRALVVAPGVARLESQAPDVDGVTYIEGNGERGTGNGEWGTGNGNVGEFVDVCIEKVEGFDFRGKVV